MNAVSDREPFIVRIERGGREICRLTQRSEGAPSFAGEPLQTIEAYRLASALCSLYILTLDGERGPRRTRRRTA
jgi:hypothetical protein